MRSTPLLLIILLLLVAPASSGAAVLPAKSAAEFRDSAGVNTHISYYSTPYGQWSRIVEKLDELGVDHLRDSVYANPTWGPWNERYYKAVELAAAHGKKFDFIMGYPNWGAGTVPELVDVVAGRLRGAVSSLEAPNEYDIVGGIGKWVLPLQGYLGELDTALAGEPRLAGVPLVGPSFGRTGSPTSLGSVAGLIDYGNIHPYTGGLAPSQTLLTTEKTRAMTVSGILPLFATEAGFHNALNATTGQPPTSEAAAAVYTLRTLLEHFRGGIRRTFLYELIDQTAEPALTQPEQHFGLLNNDFTPKPAFTALKNLLAVVGRPGAAGSLKSVDIPMTGATTGVQQLLLQKPSGGYQLVLWLDKSVWDRNNRKPIAVPAQRVTVTLPSLGATIARPLTSATKAPLAMTNKRVASVDVQADPVVIDFIVPSRTSLYWR